MDIIPSYDIEEINLFNYNNETRNSILSNLKNYIKLEKFKCYGCNLTELPDLPSSLNYFHSIHGNLLHQTYYCCQPDTTIKSNEMFLININQINAKNKGTKKMKLLNRTLLLEQSAKITMNPKRIERLLDNKEINFFDGSFDNLTS